MTSKRPIKPPVVAQVPKTSTLGVTTYPDKNGPTYLPSGGSADRMASQISRHGTKELFGEAFDYEMSTPEQRKAFELRHNINQPAAQVGGVDALGGQDGLQNILAAIRSGGGGGGSSTAAADALARDKFNAEQASNATSAATALRALQGLQGRLASGGYRGNADTLLGLINNQNTQGQAAIWDNYNTGINNINAGYDTAQGMVNTGYGDLNQYLNANQSNPYANLQQQSGPVNNAMANYLSAYGVSNDPVNQQVQASQMANQQGADSYNQLQQMMSANQLSNNQSNLGLSQMAQNYATTGLGSQRAGYQANADTTRTNAMNQLMQQIEASRYGVEEDVGTRRNALEEAIIAAGGSLDGSMAGGGVDGNAVAPGSATARSKDVASAADNYPNFKAALAAMNPNYKFTTMAAAKKKFPALANAF